jgi:hypothetical protein
MMWGCEPVGAYTSFSFLTFCRLYCAYIPLGYWWSGSGVPGGLDTMRCDAMQCVEDLILPSASSNHERYCGVVLLGCAHETMQPGLRPLSLVVM